MPEMADWVDLGVPGARLALADYAFVADLAQGPAPVEQRWLCVYRKGGFARDVVDALAAAGFVPSMETPDLMGRPGDRRDVSDFLEAFPDARAVSVPSARVASTRVAKPPPFVDRRRVATATMPPPLSSPAQDAFARPPAPLPGRIPASPSRRMGRPGATLAPVAAPSAPPAVTAPEATVPGSRGQGPTPAGPVTTATPKAASRRTPAPPPAAFEDPEQINAFQRRYVPTSRIGKPIATIPLNLAGPTMRALSRVERAHGPVDAFVASRLGWTPERMADLLSPEQVDAVALGLHSMDRGQGFVLADMTGLGKGRVLAAICRGIVLSGGTPVFITEKENLFSDFWRDVRDIDSADVFGRPFMLNDGARIVDTSSPDGLVIHEAWKKKDVSEYVRRKRVPDGCRIVMASYSQFNRAGSAKAEFLREVAKGRQLVCDECHNAVGDSATSENLAKVMDDAASVTFSSATFARNAQNLAAYKRLFPQSMRSSDVMDVLKTGGHAISEALTQMLAEEGSYVRREHDLSTMSLDVRDDEARMGRNQVLADTLSAILARIGRLSRQVKQYVDTLNEGDGDADGGPKRKRRELYTTGNFGSRLQLVSRQFATALLVDYCIEIAVADLLADRKPVIVIETTMETLMRELASDSLDGADDDAAPPEAAAPPEGADGVDEAVGKGAPTFRDALRLMVARTMQMNVRRGKDDPVRVDIEVPDFVAEAGAIGAMIDAYPDVSLSPIDDIRDGVERAGRERGLAWVMDEVSARGMRVVDGAYVRMPPQDRVATVARFNAGPIDGLVLTGAASTGLSLHAGERFLDQRVRHMIELQIASNTVARLQFLGRVDRRGQVVRPVYSTLSTGLPFQVRTLALQNRKVADMSANVTASQHSAMAMEVPDIIDSVGNAVARRYLEENPDVADEMQVAMRLKDMETAEAELYFVNKILQRLILLPSGEQDRIYGDVIAAYEDAVAEMRATGRSPRGAREMEGEWTVVSCDVFEPGDPRDGEVFGRAVTITTIESARERRPLTLAQVEALVAAADGRLAALAGAEPGKPFKAWDDAIARARSTLLKGLLGKQNNRDFHLTVEAALRSQRPNPIKEAEERLMQLRNLVAGLRPGLGITVQNDDGTDRGVVVDIRAPHDMALAHQPGRWGVRYVVPGDEEPRELSMAAVLRNASFMASQGLPPMVAAQLKSTPRGMVSERRRVLDGNPVRAVMAARRADWGSHATWRDPDGRLNRSILVPRSAPIDLDRSLAGRTSSPVAALAVLGAGGQLWTNQDRPEAGAKVEVIDGAVQVEVPADKRLSKPFETDRLRRLLGEWCGMSAATRYADVPVARAPDVVAALLAAGHALNFDGRYRPHANRALDGARAEPEPEPAGPRP